MPIPWNDDPSTYLAVIAANVTNLARTIDAQAAGRVPPLSSLAFDWHRAIYDGVPLPVPYYAGEIRDSDPRFPELIGYDVQVGGLPGVHHGAVPGELAAFDRSMLLATSVLDPVVPSGARPGSIAALSAVVRLAANAHGEWVRIHPFANGNGRTARAWANFVLLRYGLAAVITIKPRPASLLYAAAAKASMTGDHGPTEALFLGMVQSAAPGP